MKKLIKLISAGVTVFGIASAASAQVVEDAPVLDTPRIEYSCDILTSGVQITQLNVHGEAQLPTRYGGRVRLATRGTARLEAFLNIAPQEDTVELSGLWIALNDYYASQGPVSVAASLDVETDFTGAAPMTLGFGRSIYLRGQSSVTNRSNRQSAYAQLACRVKLLKSADN